MIGRGLHYSDLSKVGSRGYIQLISFKLVWRLHHNDFSEATPEGCSQVNSFRSDRRLHQGGLSKDELGEYIISNLSASPGVCIENLAGITDFLILLIIHCEISLVVFRKLIAYPWM